MKEISSSKVIYALFDSNYAEENGGALYIFAHVNFMFCGSIYSGSNSISFDPGALPLDKAKAFDTECSTDNALSFNNSIIFLHNTADKYGGGSINCQSATVATVTFIGTMYFNENYASAIIGDSCNMNFVGTT